MSSVFNSHVWHQQRKVTPFAGSGGYRYRRYRWYDPERERARVQAANMDRWLGMSARMTVGDAARQTTSALSAAGCSFRLVDGNGRAHGSRLQVILIGSTTCLVEDQQGRQRIVGHVARVRVVKRQAEDPHSFNSRVLQRAHRQLITSKETP
jgi:hypothetical protein